MYTVGCISNKINSLRFNENIFFQFDDKSVMVIDTFGFFSVTERARTKSVDQLSERQDRRCVYCGGDADQANGRSLLE